MKSYIQGLITGGVLVFALLVLIGSNRNSINVGRYQLAVDKNRYFLDTATGRHWIYKSDNSLFGDEPIKWYWKELESPINN